MALINCHDRLNRATEETAMVKDEQTRLLQHVTQTTTLIEELIATQVGVMNIDVTAAGQIEQLRQWYCFYNNIRLTCQTDTDDDFFEDEEVAADSVSDYDDEL